VLFTQTFIRRILGDEEVGVAVGFLRGGLALASIPYGMALRCRNRLFDAGWLPREVPAVPVVSVGNLTAGGTGKTPCVEYVARFLTDWKRRVVILSRGYGGFRGRNDEAKVLEANLPGVPHLQGPDRAKLARVAVSELAAEALVLDDGFQHRRLQRDLDIVLIDATDPWGSGFLLPRGLLREPLTSLERADIIVITRCDQVDEAALEQVQRTLSRLARNKLVVRASHAPMHLVNAKGQHAALSELNGKPVAAFCGIGNPESFRRTLVALGADLREFRVFSDHHAYSSKDRKGLHCWAQKQVGDCILCTTQKDLVKLRVTELDGRPLWAVRIALQVLAGKEAFDSRLRAVLHNKLSGGVRESAALPRAAG